MSSHAKCEKLVAEQLELLGFDLNSNGLQETPARVARYHGECLLAGGDPVEEAAKLLKAFDAPENGGLIAIQSSFFSQCEHHLLPFEGIAQVVYLPGKLITGLSKINRALDIICRRPQVQERVGAQMADAMMILEPIGVLVDLQGRHSCMTCRGVRDPQSRTRTRVLRGDFIHDADLRTQAILMLM